MVSTAVAVAARSSEEMRETMRSRSPEEKKEEEDVAAMPDMRAQKSLETGVRRAAQSPSVDGVPPTRLALQRSISLDLSPAVQVEKIESCPREVYVARDDLLQGGTKQRAIVPFLLDMANAGCKEFVYASPPSGFAQVALASACKQLGYPCVLFCVGKDDGGTPSANFHEFSVLAGSFGAVTYALPDLRLAELAADEYAKKRVGAMKLPLGFASPDYTARLREALEAQWVHVLEAIGREPSEIWIPVGSATLGGVFRSVAPGHIPLHCVDVHVLRRDDDRIARLCELPNVHYHDAPEMFADAVQIPAPIPSNAYYDAKLWRFIHDHAAEGALWWNVAR